jgi:vanillate O-demethylase ferredoxin subunit
MMIEVEVIKKSRETKDISLFQLARVDRAPLPSFTAGAHIDVHLPNGLVRQYSLCNAPKDQLYYEIGVFNDPDSRGGSVLLHEVVNEGDRISISEPRNLFPLDNSASHHLLIAGGIGITPLLCMAEQLTEKQCNFDLHYCAKSQDHAGFINRINDSEFADRSHYHFSQRDGRLNIAEVLRHYDSGTHLYVCGPVPFMDAVLETAKAEGWPEAHLHREYFAAAKDDSKIDAAFEIQLGIDGEIIEIPADKTALEVLIERDIDVPFACEEGVCGSCSTRLLEGEPEHRDVYMTAEEHLANQEFAICCSRSKSPKLVIDL